MDVANELVGARSSISLQLPVRLSKSHRCDGCSRKVSNIEWHG